jgi:hypothetical protein
VAIAVSVLILCGIGYAARALRSQPMGPDDSFLSYWQCADGLTTALTQVKSHEEFVMAHPKVGDRNLNSGQSIKDVCDDLCEQLEAYKAALEKIPEDEMEESAALHSALVTRVKNAVASLTRRHTEAPQILGDDWGNYADALQPPGAPQ